MHIHEEVDQFQSKELASLAKRIEAEFVEAFRPFGARLVLQPNAWSHLLEVGEGFEVNLQPDNPTAWEYWGNFESCIEVFKRLRWSQEWKSVKSLEETEVWVRQEIQQYLIVLKQYNNSAV